MQQVLVFSKRSLMIGLCFVLIAVSVMALGGSAQAATCSGAGCNGKNPATTGCNQNAYLVKRILLQDKYGIVISTGLYAEVYYSRTCGTNWLRFPSNPWGGNAHKEIWTSSYYEVEDDYTYGSSYSMMVYAPGSTWVRVFGKLYDRAGVPQAWLPITVLQ